MKVFLRDTLTTLIVAIVIYFGLRTTIQSTIIVSSSMEPNFLVGQRLIINRVVYKFHNPERGDVIVFPAPDNQRDDYIKRIIGLPGELVEIKEGTVYVHKEDGSILTLDEPYISQPTKHSFQGEKIPKNEYLVLGDNRNNSGDSRQGWTVPQQKIIGKAWLSIWPPAQWGLVATPYQSQ